MNKNFAEKLLKYIRAHRIRRRWINAVSLMAACVVFVVTYMLILPAITIESQKSDNIFLSDNALSDSAVIIENTDQNTQDSFASSDNINGGKITDSGSESVAISDTPVNDITNVNNDEIQSGSAIVVADNIVSDGALNISLIEKSSEKEAEILTEATTISFFDSVALASQGAIIATYSDTANNAYYAISSTASGSYKITAEPINGGAYSIASDVLEHLQSINKTQIESLEIADGVVSVGSGAFRDCSGLKSVDIAPNSTLTTIESASFSGCSKLSSINLEDCSALQSIGCKGIDDITSQAAESDGAFYGSALTSVTLPSSVTEIGSYAFAGCSKLESVDFGNNSNNVSFGAYIFKDDTSLKSVNIEALSGAAKFYTIQATINGTTENVNAMFSGCSNLKFLKLSTVSADSNLSYLCYGCSSLESLDLGGASGLNLTYSNNSPGFEENVICYELNNIIAGCDSLKTLDLSALTNMTILGRNIIEGGVETVILPYNMETLTSYSCSSSNLLNVEFEKDENGKSHLKNVLNYAFSNNTGIKEITLDFSYADSGTAQLCAAVFRNCSNLEKVTVISDDAMKYFGIWDTDTMPSGIKELVYNVHSVTDYTGIKFVDNESFKLTLGDNVSMLDAKFMAVAKGHITSCSFVSNHAFMVGGAGDFPLDEASLYYADAGGNLYRQKGDEAELVYANRDGSGECIIPSQVSFSYNGSTYNLKVTAIGRDAFKGTGYESILFESPENITSVENRAFADAFQLSRIGKKTAEGSEYYNDENSIKGMFTNAKGGMGSELFVNTAIISVPFDSGIEESSDGSIYYTKADGKPIETFYINRITTSSVSWLDGQQGCLATGETGFFEIKISYNAGDNHMFRMYVKTYDDCILSYGTYFNSEGVETKTEPVDCGDGVYYYYIPSGNHNINNISIGFTYPDNTAPNKSVYVWSVRGESEADLTALGNAPIYPTQSGVVEGNTNIVTSSKYLKYTWKTKADTFAVSKEANANITPTFVKSGSEICVGGVSFSVKLSRTTQFGDVRLGNDHVKYVRYEDVMTLPEGLSWRGNPAEWTNARYVIAPGGLTGIIYASIDGKEYTVCEVELYNEKLISLSLETKLQTITDSEGNTTEITVPVICWTLENVDKTTEIPNPTEAILIYGSELIIAENVSQDAHYNEITNEVTAYVDYCFSPEAAPVTSSAALSISEEKGGLSLKKETLTSPSFYGTHNLLGEDMKYRITLKNETAFSYTGAVKITDNLFKDSAAENRRILYIKPENMQQMFDDKYGDKLTITINDAILYNTLPDNTFVTAVDGSTTIKLSSANTSAEVFGDDKYDVLGEGAYEYYNGRYDTADVGINCEGTITVTKQIDDSGAGFININYPVKSEDGTINYDNNIKVPDNKGTIEDAFESIGYVVTKYDSYSLMWDYGENETVKSGEARIYNFVASVKNTFQYLSYTDKGGEDRHNGGDHYRYYNEPDWDGEIIIDNTATLIEGVGESTTEVIASADASPKVLRDLVVEKHAYRDGVLIPNQAFATSFSVKDENTVITYNVEATHFGNGVYDVLPVVDHITGIQAVLAPVSFNQGQKWVELYNPDIFTYNGVDYYVLNKDGIYEGVQLDNRYADKVIVKTDNINGRDTIIKWYCADVSYDTVINFTYNAIVSMQYAGVPSIGTEFTLSSESWLNDHPSHRIWDPILGGGTTILFDKNILVPKTDSETGETVYDSETGEIVYETVKDYPISMNNNTVRYRLEIGSSGGNGRSVTGADIYDMLPVTGDTAGIFAWRKEADGQGNPANVSIDYEVTDPTKVQILYGEGDNRIDLTSPDYTGFDEYTLQYDCPATDNVAENDSFQQYIKWDDSFEVHFGDNSSNCTAYIYVTLTFPNTLNEWSDYIAACGSKTLSNTLYLFNMHSEVTHRLASPGKALFQKGVYETGYYVCNSWSGNYTRAYYREKDRFHYSRTVGDGNAKYFSNNEFYFKEGKNENGEKVINTIDSGNVVNTVTYYVIIKNEGDSYLNLSTIYDVLPKGFDFMAFTPLTYAKNEDGNPIGGYPVVGELSLLTNPPESARNKCYLYNWCESPLAKTSSYKRPSTTKDNGETIETIYPYVKYEGTDSVSLDGVSKNRLKFKIYKDPDCTEKLEYLKEGEELQFGYTCYTGSSSPDLAENICAMEFIDNAGVGVTQVDNDGDKVEVWNTNVNQFQEDYGDRQVIEGYDNAEMLGFTEKDGNNKISDVHKKWLASSVDVEVGEVSPQIEEMLISEGSYDCYSVPQWKILSENSGTGSMAGYTISDTMDYPYKFQGSVTYSVFAGDGSSIYTYTPDAEDEAARAAQTDRLKTPLMIQTAKDGYLFTIGERSENSSTVKIITNKGEEVDLEIGVQTTINVVMTNIHNREFVIPLNITISENADLSETISLTSNDAAWTIPAGGRSEMTLQTAQTPVMKKNKDYYNASKLTTANNTVNSSLPVSISNASSSSSSKKVTELVYDSVNGEYVESGNTANSETADNKHICLSNKSNRFRYTLTIQNNGSANKMEKLVITDNLPFIGDRTPTGEAERGSRFMVKFADDPNIHVMSAKLDEASGEMGDMKPKSCEVRFSDKCANFTATDLYGDLDLSGNWYEDKKDTSRSVRFIIEGVDKGERVTITFDAVADENAAAGMTAWNSFVYKYADSTDATGNLQWIQAAPDKVGVQVPSAPNIVKSLKNSVGDAVTADKDYSFDFILYEGETKNFMGYSEAEICSELTGTDFTKLTLEVNSAASESSNLVIESGKYHIYEYNSADRSLKETDNMFTFDAGKQYNVVEISPSADNYSFGSFNPVEGEKQYTFTYVLSKNEDISVSNTRKDWQITITKMNVPQTKCLKGAVFGLYRKYVEGADNTANLTAEQLTVLKDKGVSMKDIVIDGEGTFYLYDVFAETDANGLTTKSNLTDDVYVVKELIAPVGFMADSKSYVFEYNPEGAAEIVTNREFTLPLPATGSYGMLIVVTAGLALISIVIAFIIRRLLISKFE